MPNGYARFNEKKQITVKISMETCHLGAYVFKQKVSMETCHLELVKGMKVI